MNTYCEYLLRAALVSPALQRTASNRKTYQEPRLCTQTEGIPGDQYSPSNQPDPLSITSSFPRCPACPPRMSPLSLSRSGPATLLDHANKSPYRPQWDPVTAKYSFGEKPLGVVACLRRVCLLRISRCLMKGSRRTGASPGGAKCSARGRRVIASHS